jgi:hypothetical protein
MDTIIATTTTIVTDVGKLPEVLGAVTVHMVTLYYG